MGTYNLAYSDIYMLMLVMFRSGAFLMTVPIFGHLTIPRIMRVWIIVLISFIIYPSLNGAAPEPPATIIQLVMTILNEVFIGLLMGYTVIIFFAAVQYGGQIIGMQMGLAIANVLDPMGAGEISLIGEFYYLLSLLIFILIDGHYYILEALIKCYDLVPVAGGGFNASVGDYLAGLAGMVFVLAVKFAAPVIITLFIMNSILGIVARTVPQMNVFIVGFPLAIGVGFALIGFTLPVFKIIVEKVFLGIQTHIFTIVGMLQS
ncbi:flagellar biosynthetic protein FliR [Candidatus Latescibacterota bacterium]